MSWTQEREGLLRSEWAAGKPVRTIMTSLGYDKPGSITGKVSRLRDKAAERQDFDEVAFWTRGTQVADNPPESRLRQTRMPDSERLNDFKKPASQKKRLGEVEAQEVIASVPKVPVAAPTSDESLQMMRLELASSLERDTLVRRESAWRPSCHAHDSASGWKCDGGRQGNTAYCKKHQDWAHGSGSARTNWETNTW